MRIAILVHQFLPKYSGGTEILTLQMARELMQRGHEVAVVCSEASLKVRTSDKFSVEDEYEGITVFRICTTLQKKYPIVSDFKSVGQVEIILSFLQTWQADLVHINHCLLLSTKVIPAIKSIGMPVVYSATDFWLVCPTIQLLKHNNQLCQGPDADGIECLRCYLSNSSQPEIIKWSRHLPDEVLKAGMAIASSLHSKLATSKAVNALKAFPERQQRILEHVNFADLIIVPTDLMREIFSRNGLPCDKLIKLPYGIEPLPKIERSQPKDTVNFGFIGTLSPHKGADLLIQAFQRLQHSSKAKLIIYGNLSHFPGYSKHLQDLAGNDPNIFFAGTFPAPQMANVLAEVDFLVVPSRWYENTPLVMHAALQVGLPVIATDLGGMSELVKDEHNGLLFALGDYYHLARQMQRCLDEPVLVNNLQRNIQLHPSKTMFQYINDLEYVYQSLF
ncbi:MAG: glycosyltransferase [Nostoc sp. NMS2]|uniref:glycosyltransferase n=1 Tax=Nostoc sp. NMS2 TaxID=2815389 RepID=UPI0025FC186E|nr:glycosyltransferase [Nostoc sp. NMS2]MBN3992492.1 glycosyltransferase [Nostoc sp. NMS2]